MANKRVQKIKKQRYANAASIETETGIRYDLNSGEIRNMKGGGKE